MRSCLDSIADATHRGERHDVYVVDNGSSDGSDELVERGFPWVKLWRARTNNFGHTYNEVVRGLETDAVLLLNNDIEVEPGFIEPLIDHLSTHDVFAVVARILLGDRSTSQGARATGGFHRGMWWYKQLPDVNRVTTTFFVPNQCAYSRRKFCELGGFDRNFWPMYHEDTDLSYRAWRHGWRILYEPSSVIYHYGGQTRTRHGCDWYREVVTQNSFLMQWKNFDDIRMRGEHLAWLGPRVARAVGCRDLPFLRGFNGALRRRPRMIRQRLRDASLRRVPDADVFARIQAGIDGDVEAASA
jgi:GT2 family glycosyltransferase